MTETRPSIGARCRVLTMDGGPSPLLQIRLIREIERRCPGFIDRVDLFAGTSDGALMSLFIAANLTRGKSPARTLDDAVTFSNGIVRALDATWCGLARLALGYAASDDSTRIKALLSADDAYGDLHMNELGRRAMVVTFDAFNWQPRFFRNFSPFCDRRPDEDARGPRLVSAALASAAFPMFLPIHYGPGKRHYVDGGLVANNPSMCALTSAAEHLRWERGRDDETVRRWLGDVCLLSLGATESDEEREATIRPPKAIPDESNAPRREVRASKRRMHINRWPEFDIDWGWMQWLAKRPLFLVNTMLQAPSNAVARQCADLLGPQHHRYGPSMGEIGAALGIMLAPPGKVIAELDERAAHITSGVGPEGERFNETVRWVERNWMRDAKTVT